MTISPPRLAGGSEDRGIEAEMPRSAGVHRLAWGLLGEVECYEAWLYAPRSAETGSEREPDHYMFYRGRDEMIEEIKNLPWELAARVVVKAMVGGDPCPIDQDGNALDPDDLHVIANAI
ncbi:MAG: hypothetical protein HYR63_11520 [Proteobacteria bacterium]|nr:hypothetical protein [Pseudomonadota bacterium]MBI3496346.1 hypothetical protein [Pseudomonadota bacterium]